MTEKRLKDNLLPCGDRIHGVTGGLGTVETSNVSLLYSDEKYEIWIDNEKDNITLSMADRGSPSCLPGMNGRSFRKSSEISCWRKKRKRQKKLETRGKRRRDGRYEA